MVGPFLTEATILIVFCHIFVNGEDILELYRPNPSLPQELNEWLAEVQEHKGDFMQIRDSSGEEPKSLFNINEDYNDDETEKEDNHFQTPKKQKYSKEQPNQLSDESPQNDIYPYMFQSLNKESSLDLPFLKNKRSKTIRSPIRLRRSYDDMPFFENKNSINVESSGKNGEVKRSDIKYPDSYIRNKVKTSECIEANDKGNFKPEAEDLNSKQLEKRELQIDIKNDGKLVKQIHEDTKNPKSIVLNINSPESKDYLLNSKMVDPNLNSFDSSYQNFQVNPLELNTKLKNTPDLNIRSETNQLKNKELLNNFNNLFTANEHLNTDNSLAHESTTSSHLFHHVPVPEVYPVRDFNNPLIPQFQNFPNSMKQNNPNNRDSHQGNFNNNNMRDMSNFWTAFEKNQMQKGIDRARINKNLVMQNVKPTPKNNNKVKDSAAGFEPAQRIEIDNTAELTGDQKDVGNITSSNNQKNMCANCLSGDNSPNCLNCMNSVNTLNTMNNLNNLKDMSVNNVNNANGLKLMGGLNNNSTNTFAGSNAISGMGGLNGLTYDFALASENNLNNSQYTSRVDRQERQLENIDENLTLIRNNLGKNMERLANISTADVADTYTPQPANEVKKSDEVYKKDLFEKVYPLERDSGAVPEPALPENVDVDETSKSAEDLNPQSEPDVSDVQNEASSLIDHPGAGNNEAVEPIADIGAMLPPAQNVDTTKELLDALPPPQSHIAPAHEKPHKYVKTIVRKLDKNFKNDNKVTEIETITEIQYPVLDEKEEAVEPEAEKENPIEEVESNEPAKPEEECEQEEVSSHPHLEEHEKEIVIEPEGGELHKIEEAAAHHHHISSEEVSPGHHENNHIIEIEQEPSEELIHEHHKGCAEGHQQHEGVHHEEIMPSHHEGCVEHHHKEEESCSEAAHHHHEEANGEGHLELETCNEPEINNEEHEEGHKPVINVEQNGHETVIDIESHHEPGETNEEMHHHHEEIVQTPEIIENRLKRLPHRRNPLEAKLRDEHNQKIRKAHAHIPRRLSLLRGKPYGFKKRKYFDNKRMRYGHRHMKDFPPSAQLIVRKREDENASHLRKRYKKRHHRDKAISDNLNSLEYENVVGESDQDVDVDSSSSSKNLIQPFIGRQLKALDYEYDANLHMPGEDKEFAKELQEVSSTVSDHVDYVFNRRQMSPRKHHAEMIHKNSAEGDYGEEEDSATETKNNDTIIKKTDDESEDQATTTEDDDYDYDEDYDSIKREKHKPKHHKHKSKEHDKKKKGQQRVVKEPTELKGHDIKAFSHHLHHKIKPKLKHKKQPRSLEEREGNSVPVQYLQDQQYDTDKLFNQRSVVRNSDFQHWPNFVLNDHENEEKLRKRSLIMKKKYPRAFSFPLASHDFFVKPQKKSVVASEVKRQDTTSPILDEAGLMGGSAPPSLPEDTEKALVSTEKGSSTSVDSTAMDEETDSCGRSTIGDVCEGKENFNKTFVQVTTILPLVSESASESGDSCNGNNNVDIESNSTLPDEKLDDVLNGKLAFQMVHNILEELPKNPKLKEHFRKGLNPDHDKSLLKGLNDTNLESQKLKESMTNILNKLQFSASCQTLPRNMKHYLKAITRTNKANALAKTKEMEEIEFDDGQNQDNFVFESSPQGDNFEGKMKVLQDLLVRFNKLPEKCKARAMPVKEYIENHMGMLNNMLNTMSNTQQNKAKPKKSIGEPSHGSFRSEDELIQEQLESLGLGRLHNFKPKFDLNQMMENSKSGRMSTGGQMKPSERPRSVNVNKRDIKTVSKKFDKLVDAVRRLRLRREGEKRLGEMYGRSRESRDYDEFPFKGSGDEDMSKANFESPLVYSL